MTKLSDLLAIEDEAIKQTALKKRCSCPIQKTFVLMGMNKKR